MKTILFALIAAGIAGSASAQTASYSDCIHNACPYYLSTHSFRTAPPTIVELGACGEIRGPLTVRTPDGTVVLHVAKGETLKTQPRDVETCWR